MLDANAIAQDRASEKTVPLHGAAPLPTVVGPDGRRLTIHDLPPPETKRWVIRRKAEVVLAVRGGLLTLEEACARYTLSIEEFLSWQQAIERHGVRGLRTTRLQDYRAGDDRPQAAA